MIEKVLDFPAQVYCDFSADGMKIRYVPMQRQAVIDSSNNFLGVEATPVIPRHLEEPDVQILQPEKPTNWLQGVMVGHGECVDVASVTVTTTNYRLDKE